MGFFWPAAATTLFTAMPKPLALGGVLTKAIPWTCILNRYASHRHSVGRFLSPWWNLPALQQTWSSPRQVYQLHLRLGLHSLRTGMWLSFINFYNKLLKALNKWIIEEVSVTTNHDNYIEKYIFFYFEIIPKFWNWMDIQDRKRKAHKTKSAGLVVLLLYVYVIRQMAQLWTVQPTATI